MNDQQIAFFKLMFVAAALWNLCGGVLGYFNTEFTFYHLFNRELTDPLYLGIFRGACGTTLVYFFAYLIVAKDPERHTGVVIAGGIGKIGFAIQILKYYLAGIANPISLVVVVGDFIFSLLFVYYFYAMYKSPRSIL